MSWETLWGKGFSGRGNSRGKCPETGACYMCKEQKAGHYDWSALRRRINRHEIRGLAKCQII